MTEERPATPAKAVKAEKEAPPEEILSPDVALGNVAEDNLVTVRTTMRPDQTLLVSEAEANDLERQGLLAKED